jgi:histidinol dehydrogenase
VPVIPVLDPKEADRWIAGRAAAAIDHEARAAVAPILADVRARGDAALLEYTRRFDGAARVSVEVRAEERREAWRRLEPERRRALEAACAAIEAFHRAQRRPGERVRVRPGVEVSREFRPVPRVGAYVPGGRAAYPSTVLMTCVPARIAGCPTVVLCTPPGPDGRVPDAVLAAAELAGVERVFAVGGAQAIAALAYGTESVPRVDKIVGPGNRYVTAAKWLVSDAVAIDLPAGPSEVVVLAGATADPRWVAAELVAQAEHGPDGLCVAIATEPARAGQIAAEVERQVDALPDPGPARATLARSAVCTAPDPDTAIDWVNALAPEHLVLMTEDDDAALARVANAGSVFLGPYATVVAGDYATGANHVLPTGGRARAAGGLALDDFGKWIQVQRVTRDGLGELAHTLTTLARCEGLEAHARAVAIRLER